MRVEIKPHFLTSRGVRHAVISFENGKEVSILMGPNPMIHSVAGESVEVLCSDEGDTRDYVTYPELYELLQEKAEGDKLSSDWKERLLALSC